MVILPFLVSVTVYMSDCDNLHDILNKEDWRLIKYQLW